MSLKIKRKSNGPTLADKIGDILSSAPISIDPEDDVNVETSANVTTGNKNELRDDVDDYENGDDEELLMSTFRKRTAQLLEDTDVRYKGKQVTRGLQSDSEDEQHDSDAYDSADDLDATDPVKNLRINKKGTKKLENKNDNSIGNDQIDEESDNAFDDEQSDSFDDEEDDSFNDEEDDSINTDDGSMDDNDDFDINNSSDDDRGTNDGPSTSMKSDDLALEDQTSKHLSKKSTRELEKGLSVRNQLKIWENLLEIRIQLQKCLTACNRTPQGDLYASMKADQKEFQDKANETGNNLKCTLGKLIDLQEVLVKRYPETRSLLKESEGGGKKRKDINQLDTENEVRDKTNEVISDDDDEEIPSDFDGDASSNHENQSEIVSEVNRTEPKRKRRKIEDHESVVSNLHKNYSRYRNDVIKKWYEKTRVATLKHPSSANHSVLDQIDYNLRDKARLIKKTQLKRFQYVIVGETKKEDNTNEDVYNVEIYDDNDFYHQLLRELIEVKSSDLNDPTQLSKQWIQLQNLRSKMKRKIDTRATKGRRIRYTVHNKLINYMAPIIDDDNCQEQAKDELFGSLFGKSIKVRQVS